MRCAQDKLRERPGSPDAEILRCAQDDSRDPAHVMSPWAHARSLPWAKRMGSG